MIRRLLVTLLAAAAALVGAVVAVQPAEAGSSSTPYIKGTVHIWYQVDAKLWNVPAAVKAAGVTGVKVYRVPADNDPIMCDEWNDAGRRCLSIWSLDVETIECRPPWRPAGVSEVCLYNKRGNPVRSGRIYDTTLDLDDNLGRKLTAAQRATILRDEIRRAVPRR